MTSITDPKEIITKHFIDSILVLKYINPESTIIDVGTGAGFPGIPLKIVYPNIHVTLLDSLNKRINFLNEVIDTLGLNESGSVETLHGRAEDFSSSKDGSLREKFDFAVSRAVANMSTLTEYCLPYVKVGGEFIAFKGDKGSEEVEAAKGAIHLLGGKLKECKEFLLPDTDITRTICIVDKKERTSKMYPRKAGTPAKKPL